MIPKESLRPMLLASLVWLSLATVTLAGEGSLGFAVDLEGEGFFMNPLVKKLVVSEVTKGSIAEAAGMKKGDLILQVDGKNIAGTRALALRPLMKLNPGETRTLRLKHADGTEVDARITKPKT
jgi:C-terminal processing protease CtpA/Prc